MKPGPQDAGHSELPDLESGAGPQEMQPGRGPRGELYRELRGPAEPSRAVSSGALTTTCVRTGPEAGEKITPTMPVPNIQSRSLMIHQ